MDKILINIDSRQRDYSLYDNPCFFRIDNYNSYIDFKNIKYIKLVSAEIPNAYYVFSASRFNINFVITATLTGAPVAGINIGTRTILLQEGNYTIRQFVNQLNITLNNFNFNTGALNLDNIFVVTDGLEFTYSDTTSRLTLTNNSADYTFDIDFSTTNTDYNPIGYYMGFRNTSYSINNGSSITGTASVDVIGENYIYLRINDYGNMYINHKTPIRTLAKIVLDQAKDDFIFNNNYDKIFKKFEFRQPEDISKLEIEILDYTGNRLDNNGYDFSITIELAQIYKEKTYEKELDELELKTSKPIPNKNDMIDFINEKHTVVESDNKTINDILKNVFDNKIPVVNDIKEEHIESKRNSKKIHRKKKKKYGFDYN